MAVYWCYFALDRWKDPDKQCSESRPIQLFRKHGLLFHRQARPSSLRIVRHWCPKSGKCKRWRYFQNDVWITQDHFSDLGRSRRDADYWSWERIAAAVGYEGTCCLCKEEVFCIKRLYAKYAYEMMIHFHRIMTWKAFKGFGKLVWKHWISHWIEFLNAHITVP